MQQFTKYSSTIQDLTMYTKNYEPIMPVSCWLLLSSKLGRKCLGTEKLFRAIIFYVAVGTCHDLFIIKFYYIIVYNMYLLYEIILCYSIIN